MKMFSEFAAMCGSSVTRSEVYELLYRNTLNASPDCGSVTAYNFLSGEPVAGAQEGHPMYFRTAGAQFGLGEFMRAQLYSAFAALRMGMEILLEKENIPLKKVTGHGGLFKVEGVAQQYLADALNTDVSVMKTAGEGGAWGMALLAAYMQIGGGISLPQWLDREVFADMECSTLSPEESGKNGFNEFMLHWKAGLKAQELS